MLHFFSNTVSNNSITLHIHVFPAGEDLGDAWFSISFQQIPV